MSKSNKFSPEVREQAVQMVQEHRGEYPSPWAAIESIWFSKNAEGLMRGVIMGGILPPQQARGERVFRSVL